MKRKTILILCLAACGISLASCNKERGEESTDAPYANTPLSITGTTDPSSKAVFQDDAAGTSLNWSDYDNLGVYSFNGATYIKGAFAAISDISGTSAKFDVEGDAASRTAWAGSAETVSFYAFYPLFSAPAPDGSTGSVALSVAPTQTGEFGRFQIGYAAKDISKEDLVTNEKDVDFAFAPKTAMLRVRPVLSAGSLVDFIMIKQVIISIADDKLIAGDCSLALDSGELTGGSSSIVNIVLPTAVKVTKTAAENPYFNAVILPATTNHAVLTFTIVASDGTSFTTGKKYSPTDKFGAGKRYNIDREIVVALSEAPDGQYIDGGNAWDESTTVEDGAYTDGGVAW